MKCPYCNEDMKLGVIHGDRYALKWIPAEKNKGVFLQTFVKGIKLTDNSGFNTIKSYLCDNCKKVIIDLPK